jgi:hypothetical protein
MTKIELEIHDDVIATINKLKNINDSGIELVVPEGSVLFDNIINLKLLEAFGKRMDMTIHYTTQDDQGNNLIEMLDEKGSQTLPQEEGEMEQQVHPENVQEKKGKIKLKIRKPNISLPKIKLTFLLIPLVLILLGGIALKILSKKPQAHIKIYVDAQSLTRSVTVRITSDRDTDVENRILKGTRAEAAIEQTQKIETTGEKTLGEKATGKVNIYNKTSEEITLKKGTKMVYKAEDDMDLEYQTRGDITIEPLAPQDPGDPGSPLIPGEQEIEVEATKIGEAYNISEDSVLELDDYKKSEVAAESKEEFEGGSSETVKVVSKADLDKISSEALAKSQEQIEKALNKKVKKDQVLIKGSAAPAITKEEYSHEIGDETKELTLNQTVTAKGLVYEKDDLDKFLDKIIADLIPEGFELYERDRETKVDILGNSTNSTLTSTDADVQVTLKTYIVPKVDKEDVEKSILGVSPEEAQKILGGLSNVKTYEFGLAPRIPFFGNVPDDTSRIHLEIVRE